MNSRNIKISDNLFFNVRNITGCGALHSIYMAHYSSENLIEGNTFQNGCGATVKARDSSNLNLIRSNRFIEQEDTLFLDSFCNKDSREDCTKETSECPSWGNEFENNTAERLGPRARKAPTKSVGPDAPSGCPVSRSASKRFIDKGNRF